MKRTAWIGLAAACLVSAYAAFGFLLLPRLLKPRLVDGLSKATGRRVAIGEVRTNPFALSVTLDDFALFDRADERIVGFKELYVNAEVRSLFQGGYAFSAIRLSAPYVRVLSRADGSTNLQDVTPAAGANPPPSSTPKTPLVVFIDHLQIDAGRVVYEDRHRATPFVAALDPMSFSLDNFAYKPEGKGVYQFAAKTPKGEGLNWRGTIGVLPFRSDGHLALVGFKARTFWEYLQGQVDFEVTEGQADVDADYTVDLGATPTIVRVSNGNASLKALAVTDRRDGSQAVTLASFAVRSVNADVTKRAVRIGEVRSEGGRLDATYTKEGTFTLATLFSPRVDPTAPTDPGPPWRATIARLSLAQYGVLVHDRHVTPAADLEFEPIRLSVDNLVVGTSRQPARLDLDVRAKLGGALSAKGTVTSDPLASSLDIALTGLALKPLQPYVNGVGDLDVVSGALSMSGHVNVQPQPGAPLVDFQGEAQIANFRAVDRALREDFLRWTRLDFNRIAYRSDRAGLSLAEIVARQAYAKVVIGPDRVTNIQHILRSAPPKAAPAPAAAPAASGPGADVPAGSGSGAPASEDNVDVTPTAALLAESAADRRKAPAPAGMATRIDQVRVVDSTLNFSDLSLKPNFVVSIAGMNGAIKGLSSQELTRAEVDLNGKVDKYAPASVSGTINPLTATAFTDVTLKFQGIDLTTFTPYSGKFAGYRIDKGKLTLDLHYVLSKRTLAAENKVVLDQLTLGEKVESPDATRLPVRLAVALLKDRHGVIDLNIPIRGSLDDPQFSVMPLVWRVLGNLVVKMVTSPFRLLGSLFRGGGDGEQMSFVAFEAGGDALPASQQAKMDTLAKSLNERPGLKVDVRGSALQAIDRARLATEAIARLVKPDGGSFAPGAATAAERTRLFALFTATLGGDPHALVPATDGAPAPGAPAAAATPSASAPSAPASAAPPTPATPPAALTPAARAAAAAASARREVAVAEAAYERLLAEYPVTEEMLRALAQRRAAAVREQLIAKGGVDEARVFLQDVDLGVAAEGGVVPTKITLDAR